MPRWLQVVLAIAAVLVADYYWELHGASVGERRTAGRGESLPRVYVDEARSVSFDAVGRLSDILEARRVQQYGAHAFSLLTEPRFYSRSRNDRTWSASARRGRYEEGRQRLLLRDAVVLVHDQSGTRLQTSALDILLHDKVASTGRPVTITRGQDRTTARGLRADLDAETITLTANVESIYVQPL